MTPPLLYICLSLSLSRFPLALSPSALLPPGLPLLPSRSQVTCDDIFSQLCTTSPDGGEECVLEPDVAGLAEKVDVCELPWFASPKPFGM